MDVHAREMLSQLRLMQAGALARLNEYTIHTCPYVPGDERGYWWRRGWEQEDHDLRVLYFEEKTFDVDYEYKEDE